MDQRARARWLANEISQEVENQPVKRQACSNGFGPDRNIGKQFQQDDDAQKSKHGPAGRKANTNGEDRS